MATIYKRGKSGFYWISYLQDGRRISYSLKVRDKKLAEHLKKQKEVEIERGIAKMDIKAKISDIFPGYLEYVKAHKAAKTFKTEIGQIKKFLNQTAPLTITEISVKSIQGFQLYLLQKGYKPRTINHFLKHIRNFLNYAIQQGYVYENPAARVKKVKEPKSIVRFLSKEELAMFIPVAETSHIWPMIATALYSGLRAGEIIRLKWKDIDFKNKIIIVRDPKNKNDRAVPLNSSLNAILEALPKEGAYCFTYTGKRYSEPPKRALATVYRRAGIKNAGFHTLRKTFASHLVMAGTSVFKVSKWLGHSDPKITASTYAHLTPRKDSDIDLLHFCYTE